MCAEHVTSSVTNGIGLLRFDQTDSKENILNKDTQPQLVDTFRKLENDPNVKAIVIMSGKTNSFVAGADIK